MVADKLHVAIATKLHGPMKLNKGMHTILAEVSVKKKKKMGLHLPQHYVVDKSSHLHQILQQSYHPTICLLLLHLMKCC